MRRQTGQKGFCLDTIDWMVGSGLHGEFIEAYDAALAPMDEK
jgi:hypothetical protein